MRAGPPSDTPPPPGRRLSLRTVITLWYGVAIAVCIVAYSLAVGYGFGRHVEAELDRRVHEDIELVARALVFNEARGLEWVSGFLGKEIDEEEGGGHWLEVWDDAGVRILTEGTMPEPLLAVLESSAASHRGRTQITATNSPW